MSLNLDFTDTSDVSDEAIQFVLDQANFINKKNVCTAREACHNEGGAWARLVVLSARLVERHYPEILADADILHVREEFAKEFEKRGYPLVAKSYREGSNDSLTGFKMSLALYKQGKASCCK